MDDALILFDRSKENIFIKLFSSFKMNKKKTMMLIVFNGSEKTKEEKR